MLRIYTLFFLMVVGVGPVAAQVMNTAVAYSDGDNDSVAATPEAKTPADVPAAQVVFNVSEEMPSFPGGASAFVNFLREKLHYPEEALRKGVSGKVHISFIIDEAGHILDPKVVRGLGSGLDEEALRLVRIMPWWIPGRNGGQPVRVAYTLPIVFRALE